jgi:membrane-associated PAP2 superfamily phosphatase
MAPDVQRFVGVNVIGLIVSGVLLLALARDGTFDWWLARQFFDATANGFPLKETPLFAQVGHTGLKWLAVAIWLGVAVLAVAARREWRAPLALALLSALLSVIVVSALKATSLHSCPWDLAMFGGKADWFALLGGAGGNAGPGRCWPGGHASGGFAMLAGYFSLRDWHPKAARTALAAALLLGATMSVVQVARGAHFMSHNLWTLWITWAVCLTVYIVFHRLRARVPATQRAA